MLLYHGSEIENIVKLEPRQADHDRPYVYLTTIRIVAGFYLCNGVERPYYWFPYGFDKDGGVQYHELYPNALREVSEGKKGCIYTVETSEKDVLPFKDMPCARLGTSAVLPVDCLRIDDCYQWLMEQKRQGTFVLKKYEEKSTEELENWHKMILQDITDKNMICVPGCAYAKFVKKKFPEIWSVYEQKAR